MSHNCQINPISDILDLDNYKTIIGKSYKHDIMSYFLNDWPFSIVLFYIYLSLFDIECHHIKS